MVAHLAAWHRPWNSSWTLVGRTTYTGSSLLKVWRWNVWQASKSWGSTSHRTSPVWLTALTWLRRLASDSFFHLLFFLDWIELRNCISVHCPVFLLQHACTALHYCTSNLHILHFFVYTSCIYYKSIYIVYSVLYIINTVLQKCYVFLVGCYLHSVTLYLQHVQWQ